MLPSFDNVWDLIQRLGTWALGSFAGAGLTVFALKTWLSERIKGSIKAEYDERIETLKAQLKNQYDEKLETLKAQLKSQSDIEIEQVKSRLSIAATQQQVRFSRLHEKRAAVIAEMYSALQELIEVVQGFITDQGSSHDSRSESYKNIQEAARKFSGLCREKRLFVPRGTADKLEDIERNIKYAANIRMLTDIDQQRGFQLTNFEEYSSQAIRELRRIAQEPLVELEDEFRRLGLRGIVWVILGTFG